MSTIAMYAIDDFMVYLMPKQAAPACPPCQSNILHSVFEDDDEDYEVPMSLLSKVNQVFKKISVVRANLPKALEISYYQSPF
ncbi:hypothetical protein PtB15_18B311 [Puccinia triticina]|nr:hypothetical protein PtB15_18B311 [Puccinia triticina]